MTINNNNNKEKEDHMTDNTLNSELTLHPTIGSSFGYGWSTMSKYFLELFLVTIVIGAIAIPMFLINAVDNYHSPAVVLLKIFALAYGIFVIGPLQYGVAYVFLKAVRREAFQVKEIFDVFENYLNIILANLLVAAIVIAGLFLLIIPGFIFIVKLAFVPYLVMDKGLDPVEAVKKSWNMTRGVSWTIFFMGFLSIFIYIGGFICLLVRAIFASMWVSSSFAAIYHAVDKEGEGGEVLLADV